MPPSPTGPLYAGAVTGGADWSNLNNAIGVEDGNNASNLNEGPGGGGHFPSQLVTSGHGFKIPSTAIIDGIKLEVKGSADTGAQDGTIQVGTPTKLSTTPPVINFWSTNAAFITWGSATSLWGRTDWTAADINSSSFGASVSAMATHATGNLFVDAVRITVYWHYAPANVPKRYYYKVYNSQTYLGDIPNITSDFAVAQDINTGGSQISVTCALSADTSVLPNSPILDETGVAITDEAGNPITDEGTPPIASLGTGSQLIRNGNRVEVTEVSYWNPNGKVIFKGVIQRWEADYGGDGGSNDIKLTIYSDGADLDHHLVRGNPYTYTVDQTQGSWNTTGSSDNQSGKLNTYDWIGQTFKTGNAVTNIAQINIGLNGTATVTVTLYTGPDAQTTLGSVTQSISVGAATGIAFNFASPIVVTPNTSYFFGVTVGANQSIGVIYQNTNVYANGTMYAASYGGGAGGGAWIAQSSADMYFSTASGTGSTTATYTNVDPSLGMVKPIMDAYIAEGGLINYTSSSIVTTGLSNVSYKYNTNTVYEALQASLSVSPYGFYYYVDLGTDTLYFKQASTTADITLIKGYHIDKFTMVATIEQIINRVFFTGGVPGGQTQNIYTLDSDATSISRYGIHLDRPTNNLVLDTTTAHTIGSAEVKELRNEQYQTNLTLMDHRLDLTTIKPGMICGFSGFGSFIDNLLLQVVRTDYKPEELTLTLGIIPKRLSTAVERVTRGYVGLQTVDNPTSPS